MYEKFATVYDKLINDVDYTAWCDYYFKIFEKFGLKPELGLDLGCGTGSITTELSNRGIDMTGVDLSRDMLCVAREKNADGNILYLNQDMKELDLYGTVSFAVSSLDCINYITDKRDLLKVFKKVNNFLDPNGLFIFDINTKHKLKNVLGNNTFVIEKDSTVCIWQNEYYPKSALCDFYLTFFNKNGELYERFDEVHTERAYEISEIKELLLRSGMKLLGVYDELSFNNPKARSERVFFVAREQGKVL